MAKKEVPKKTGRNPKFILIKSKKNYQNFILGSLNEIFKNLEYLLKIKY